MPKVLLGRWSADLIAVAASAAVAVLLLPANSQQRQFLQFFWMSA